MPLISTVKTIRVQFVRKFYFYPKVTRCSLLCNTCLYCRQLKIPCTHRNGPTSHVYVVERTARKIREKSISRYTSTAAQQGFLQITP